MFASRAATIQVNALLVQTLSLVFYIIMYNRTCLYFVLTVRPVVPTTESSCDDERELVGDTVPVEPDRESCRKCCIG